MFLAIELNSADARAPTLVHRMIDEDDQNYASEDAYDAAPLLTKNYGSCATASRLRLDPPSKRRRSFAQHRRYFCLAYGFGLAFLVGGVLDVIFRIGPYRGKPKWRRRGYRRATHTPTSAPTRVSDTT